jgi:O-antigen/teichoic acid export membrane protein
MAEPEPVAEPTTPVPARKRGSFGGNVLKLASGATIAQVITLLTYPILSRLFLPEVFGVWQVFSAIVSVISPVVCLRYDAAVVLPHGDEEAANVFGVSLVAGLINSGLTAIIVGLAGETIVRLLKSPGLRSYLWLIPVAVLIHGLWRATYAWNTRTRRFGRASIAQVAGSATTSALPIGLAALGQANAGALVVTWVLGWVANTGVLAGQVWRDAWALFRRSIRWSGMLAGLKRFRKFPLVDTWGTLINAIALQLPPLMLAAFFSETVVGYYSPAYRVIVMPLTLVGYAIVPVFLQRASEVRDKPGKLARTVELIFSCLVALGLFPSILLTIGGRELFMVALGRNWGEAGVYAQILAPWMFFLFLSVPLSTLFTALERQEYAFVAQLVIFLTRAVALTVGGLLQNIYLALGIWSFTGVLVYGGFAIWNAVLAGVPFRLAMRILLRHALYGIPALAILLPLKLWLGSSAWLITGVMVALLSLYYLWILWRNPELYRYVRTAAGIRTGRGGAE